MSDERAKLISKVQKLLSLAAGYASIEESSSAAAKAQELIERYKIQQAEMEVAGAPRAGIGTMELWRMSLRTPRGHAMLVLVQDLAPVFDCYAFTLADKVTGDWAVLVGQKTDMETAATMLRFLVKAVDNETKVFGMRSLGARYENGFRLGMISRLVERLTAIRNGVRSCASERALVLLRDKVSDAEQMIKSLIGEPEQVPMRRTSSAEAEFLGSLAGDRVELLPKLKGATA